MKKSYKIEVDCANCANKMEDASSRKSKSEDFISKFARVYTPAVCYAALALAILPPLVRMLFMGLDPAWGDWIYRALTFLVISCPCALVISIPLSFFAGIGGASNAGVLVKGSNYLETLSQTKIVVFDKTGTLTQGVFEVSGIHHNKLVDDDPMKISKAIRISRKCLRIVYQNIVFAIGIKLLCLLLGALGLANMWLAIFADVGVMVIAVLNAIRALFVKNL